MRIESTPSKKRSAFFVAWVRSTATLTTHTGGSPDKAGSPKQRKRAKAKALRRAVKTADEAKFRAAESSRLLRERYSWAVTSSVTATHAIFEANGGFLGQPVRLAMTPKETP